jgi:hypothetical protein
MAVKVKITPFEKTFKLVIDRNLSPKARSQRVAAFARKEIDTADAQNARVLGSAPPKTVTVDGRQGAPLESVNPDRGTIIAEWRLVGDVLTWIMATLKQRSPVISGRYRDSHTLYADGAETDAANPPLAQEYIFLNPEPYARKIEIGMVKGPPPRPFVIQVENRIYQRTADDARARFGNIAKIRFTYQSAVGGKSRADRVPAIMVTLK